MNEISYEERAKIEKPPLKYEVYKGLRGKFGALRLSLKKAWSNPDKFDKKGKKAKKEGVIFLDMVPTIGLNKYDWENQKMTMALSVTDIGKIILYLRMPNNSIFSENKLKIFHDRGAGTHTVGQDVKTLTIDKPRDAHSFFFNMYHKNGDDATTASVPVTPDEALVIGTLLGAAIPRILAW
jgi:hypothetical protein